MYGNIWMRKLYINKIIDIKILYGQFKLDLKKYWKRVDAKSSRGGLEVERPLRIQLKAGHFCIGGLNPNWDIYI